MNNPISKDFFSIIAQLGCIVLLGVLLFEDFPGMVGMVIVLVITGMYSYASDKNLRSYALSLWITTCFIYLTSAFIISQCFSETEFHLASDPIRYIAAARNHSINGLIKQLEQTYFELQDNNGLYNFVLFGIGTLCKSCGVVASSFILTLLESLFGILTIITLFRILCKYFPQSRAYSFSIVFGFCSLVLPYSCIIVRDIILTFLFIKAVEIVLSPFSTKGLFYLLLMTLAAFGVRIFSGCFFGVFIVYYLYFSVESRRVKALILPLMIVILMGIASSSFMDEMFTKTSDEITYYNGWQTDEAQHTSGLSGALRKLPAGISNIALLLFSQANPFPPYVTLIMPDLTFQQFYLSLLFAISAIWWFYVSYSLFYYFFFNKGYKKISIKMRWLFAIAMFLMLVTTYMHVDVRRIMPAYPIIYLLFLLYRHKIEPIKRVKYLQAGLWSGYFVTNLLYLMLKF